MRMLFLTQWYPPEPEIRGHLLAAELVSRGHHVTVITGFPNYPQGKIYPGYRQRIWQREQKDGVNIIRVPLYAEHSGSGLKRMLNYFSFALSASVLGSLLSGSAEILWVYHPPLTVGIPAYWISLVRRIPYIYEIQDMWPETLIATQMVNSRWVLNLLAAMAKCIYRRAAAITVISPGFKANLIAKQVPASKIHIIPNWADEATYRPEVRDPAFGERYGLANRFNIIFAGTMGPAQGLHHVIEATSLLRDIPQAQFVFIGHGIELDRLKSLVESKKLTNVRFIEQQPAQNMPQFFAWADAVLVHLRNDPLFHITIPSKTLSYMASARPIICAVAGDAADVVREANAGVICPPENPTELAKVIRELYEMPAEEREAFGRAGREAILKHYTRQALVDRYETLFDSVVQRSKNPQFYADKK